MILETKQLTLRPLASTDFEAVHSWGGNPENTRYMAWGPNSEDDTKEHLTTVKPGQDFAVVLKETNAVIGSCGIYPDESGYMADLGWILHKDYWKNGYGTELAGELIRYGFEDLKIGRIQAPCAAANYGSCRVMERNGMQREGLHRKSFWARVDKEWIDEARYAILAEDYFQKQSTNNENNNLTIRLLNVSNLPEYADVIRKSFATVAQEFGYTQENCPGHTSFITDERLKSKIKTGYYPFGYFEGEKIIGFASLTDVGDGVYELNDVAVLSEERNKKCGKALLDFCKAKVTELGGNKITIGIIEENTVLKNWYIKNDFIHTGTKQYKGLPFIVGHMEWGAVKGTT